MSPALLYCVAFGLQTALLTFAGVAAWRLARRRDAGLLLISAVATGLAGLLAPMMAASERSMGFPPFFAITYGEVLVALGVGGALGAVGALVFQVPSLVCLFSGKPEMAQKG